MTGRAILARAAAAGMAALLGAALARAQAPAPPKSAADILQELLEFRTTGTVLMIAAHPDDEDTQLIAYFARGQGYRTGYLSLNRGEGGQDLIGPELGDELGVMRTEELLAARRVDGAEQFFTRARDFGYSKDYRDTLRRWGEDEILSDVVRVIREFQPDVIVTRFSPKPGPTHGHHTASAYLAVEAFPLAGDAAAFRARLAAGEQGRPLSRAEETAAELPPWQPKRVLWDAFRFPPWSVPADALRLDIGGYDPVLGESFGEIAALSRSNHRTQGFGIVGTRGPRYDEFALLAGAPAEHDIFDGIDTTWARYPGGAAVARLTDAAIAGFDARDPSRSVPALLAIRARLAALPVDTALVRYRRAQLDRILQACLGLYVEATVPSAEVVPRQRVPITVTAIVRTHVPVRWLSAAIQGGDAARTGARTDSGGRSAGDGGEELRFNAAAQRRLVWAYPTAANGGVGAAATAFIPPSQPYWLVVPGTPARFAVTDPSLIGRPENPPVTRVAARFEVGGQTLRVALVPNEVLADPARGEQRWPLTVIPPVSVAFSDDVALLGPASAHAVVVEVAAARPDVSGALSLLPAEGPADAGWSVAPRALPFHLAAAGQVVRLTFTLTSPPRPAIASFVAMASVGGRNYDTGRMVIQFSHIPRILLQPVARLRAVSLRLAVRGRRIGYLPGAGDDIPAALARMGCTVTTLTDGDLTPGALRPYSAVVLGIRAFNTRPDLPTHLPGLLAYVAAGGTVVEQYDTPNHLLTNRLGPYPLTLNRDLPAYRVTDENAAITLLEPDDPVFTTPNRIGPADFEGWVQERGLNFPSSWDPRYETLLSCQDRGDPPLVSGLLVARYGRGHFVVTGLSFFRQLPAGVPGAYRLFANLISLGQ